jgi:hypothetical protein
MSAGNIDYDAGSIYEKFKENTQKIFNEESFKQGLDKGYKMLKSSENSKNTNRRNEVYIIYLEIGFLTHMKLNV